MSNPEQAEATGPGQGAGNGDVGDVGADSVQRRWFSQPPARIATRLDEIGRQLTDRRARARTSCLAERGMGADLGTPPPTCPEGAW